MTPRMLAARVADLTVTALAEEDLKFRAVHGFAEPRQREVA